MASPNTLRIMAEKNKVQSKRYMAWVSVVVDPDAKTQTRGKTFEKPKKKKPISKEVQDRMSTPKMKQFLEDSYEEIKSMVKASEETDKE